MAIREHKRGDTFAETFARRVDGVLSPFPAGTVIRSQMRSSGDTLIETFDVVLEDQTARPGVFSLTAPTSRTKLWPLGEHRVDIEFVRPVAGGEDFVTSTKAFVVRVVADVTRMP